MQVYQDVRYIANMMHHRTSVVVSVIVVVVLSCTSAAPTSTSFNKPEKSRVPFWHMPCGGDNDVDVLDPNNLDEEITANLKKLRIQHGLMMNDYLSRDYEFLYERVRIGVHEHQYIPNWLPGKKDVHTVRRLKHASSQMVSILYSYSIAYLISDLVKDGWQMIGGVYAFILKKCDSKSCAFIFENRKYIVRLLNYIFQKLLH